MDKPDKDLDALGVEFVDLPQDEKNRRLMKVCASWYDDKSAARMTQMLADGADPNATVDGVTPLQRLVGQGELPELFEMLLAAGADPAVTDANGDTPLHVAAKHGNVAPVKLFLDAGVPIDSRDANGATPLHRAASGSYDVEKVVTMLLERGADVEARDHAGRTVIDVANHVVKPQLVKATSKPTGKSTTALLAAVAADDVDKVRRLLADGADPCAVDTSGKDWGRNSVSGVAALHLAFTRDISRAVVETLLAVPSIDLGVRSVANRAPLHFLIQYGRGAARVELVKQLLAMGADPDAADDSGETPIFGLTSFYKLDGELELLEILVAAGADLKRRDRHGHTMLDRMFEQTMEFHGTNDKPGFVRVMTKLVELGVSSAHAKQVASWLQTKGAKYLGTARPAKPQPPKARSVFARITGGKLARLVGKDTYLTLGKTQHAVALFDWFAFPDEQADDEHDYVDQLREYHIAEAAAAKVSAEQWIPFGVVGMTGSFDSYEETGVDGTLYLDLGAANGGDAPVVFASQSHLGLEPTEPLEIARTMYSVVMATLTHRAPSD